MKSKKKSDAAMKNTMTTVLMLPVAVCAVIGVIVMFSDTAHGASLLGLAVVLGVINIVVIKVMFKKFSKEGEGQ